MNYPNSPDTSVRLFDNVLVTLPGDTPSSHAGIVLGLPTEGALTVGLLGAGYCESDGRKEAHEQGRAAQFFRADAGHERQQLVVMVAKATKVALNDVALIAQAPESSGRGVVDDPAEAICSPEPLAPATTPFPFPRGGSISPSTPKPEPAVTA